jgi:hypothetical protein
MGEDIFDEGIWETVTKHGVWRTRNSLELGHLYRTPDMVLLEDYRLMLDRRFARTNAPESYVGGGVNSW